VLNVTNNQTLTGFPLTVALSASKSGGSSYTINASFDRRTDAPVDRYSVTASNVPAGDIAFGQADLSRLDLQRRSAVKAEAVVPGSRLMPPQTLIFSILLSSSSATPGTTWSA